MGKDREGRFHPRKGRPSAEEGLGTVKSVDTYGLKEHLELEDKYTDGELPGSNVQFRHRNRKVEKRDERQREREAQRLGSPSNRTINETLASIPQGLEEAKLPSRPTMEIFAELASFKQPCCISLYLTTNDTRSVETNRQKAFIGFKNKLQQLTGELRKKGVEQTRIEDMLRPGYDLLRTESFWGSLSKGLAAYFAEGYFKYIRLPIAPGDKALINSTFYLAPLAPVLTGREYFYVLVLSKKRAKLYRADAFGMEFIDVPGMPRGVSDVVHFEHKDDQNLVRTSTIGAGSGASFHGMGTGRPDHKTDLAMYFDEVDETVRKEVLRDENVPLVLVGVEYLIPIYKQVARYKPIWPEALTGSREHEDISQLYSDVRELMEPYFKERVGKGLTNYANQSATELTSSIADDVIPAAHYGRVSQLFAMRDAHIWGSFDEMNDRLTVNESPQENDECLLDKSVVKTMMTGGEVFILDAAEMPGGSKLAALMRY